MRCEPHCSHEKCLLASAAGQEELCVCCTEVISELIYGFIVNLNTEFLQLNEGRSGTDVVNLVEWKLPIFVVQPRFVEIDLVRLLLSESRADFDVLSERDNGSLCADAENPYRLVAGRRTGLTGTYDEPQLRFREAPRIVFHANRHLIAVERNHYCDF